MTKLNAMADLLDIISNPKTVQTINDRTLDDATTSFTASRPDKVIGQQARYYDALQTRLNAGQAEPEVAAVPVPFKPRTPT